MTRFNLCRSPEDAGPVYGVEQTEDSLSASNAESSGKKLDKDLKPRSLKGDMTESLSQYDLNSYPSERGKKPRFFFLLLNRCFILAVNVRPSSTS